MELSIRNKSKNNQLMLNTYFILALFFFTYVESQSVILTPILPSSAFQNQFYQVRFRVRGMVGASFEFDNLPQFFTASSSGIISGVPTKQGLFPIEVRYSNGKQVGSQQVIIEVRRGTKLNSYNTDPSQQVPTVPEGVKLKPKQEFLYLYAQGDQLDIDINVRNGVQPYTYSPIYLPKQLNFDNKTGSIFGKFNFFGDYVLGLNIKDARGKQIQVLIKITISRRDKTSKNQTNSTNFIFYRRSLINIDFNQLSQSTNVPAIEDKTPKTLPIQNLNTNQNPLLNGGGVININSQSNIEKQTQKQYRSAQPIIPQETIKKNQQTTPEQIVTVEDIVNKNITVKTNMQEIERKKKQIQQQLLSSQENLAGCYKSVQFSRSIVENLYEAYDIQNLYGIKLKGQLQKIKTNSQRAKIDLQFKLEAQKSQNKSKQTAQNQYKRAKLSFDNVDYALAGSKKNQAQSKEKSLLIQSNIQDLKRQLDELYKDLDNSLGQKQKLKQQLASTQYQIQNGYMIFNNVDFNQQLFGGCENVKFYPKSAGVGQVKRVMQGWYLLTNHKFITFGLCTDHQEAVPGDYISWNGYMTNGMTSAIKIKKIK